MIRGRKAREWRSIRLTVWEKVRISGMGMGMGMGEINLDAGNWGRKIGERFRFGFGILLCE